MQIQFSSLLSEYFNVFPYFFRLSFDVILASKYSLTDEIIPIIEAVAIIASIMFIVLKSRAANDADKARIIP